LLLLALLALTPSLLLPPLVRIDGAIVPLLEKLDPLDSPDPDDDDPDELVEVNWVSPVSLWAQTRSTSRVFVSGTCSATVRTRPAIRSTAATIDRGALNRSTRCERLCRPAGPEGRPETSWTHTQRPTGL
jgi:hypothetical protein